MSDQTGPIVPLIPAAMYHALTVAHAEIARLRLTAEEREAVAQAIGWIESPGVEDEAMPEDYLPITATLRKLLERLK